MAIWRKKRTREGEARKGRRLDERYKKTRKKSKYMIEQQKKRRIEMQEEVGDRK